MNINPYASGRVNQNLLDNWYFVGGGMQNQFPINQHGKNSYTGAANLYGIDRWKMQEQTATVTVTADGINVSNAASCFFIQLIENPERLMGKQVTLSVLRKDGLLVTATSIATEQAGPGCVTPESTNAGTSGNCYLYQYIRSPLAVGFAIETKAFESPTYIAAKLELGSVQTLAHLDTTGKWVLNEVPDYGEQLARCQRFQFCPFRSDGIQGYLGPFQSNGDPKMYGVIPTPVTMRTKPRVVLAENALTRLYHWNPAGTTRNITGFNVYGIGDNHIQLEAVLNDAVPAGYNGYIYANGPSSDLMIFDANL